jgi:hypothetical protein
MFRFTSLRIVAALLAMATLASCGSDGVAPEAYVKSICESVGSWVSGIQAESGALNEAVSGGDAAVAKQKLDEFLGTTVTLTDTLLKDLDEAGVPDVDGGEEFAKDMISTFEEAKTALEDAQGQVAALPEDDPTAFQTQAQALGASIQETMSNLGSTLGDGPDELGQIAQDEAACQSLAGG